MNPKTENIAQFLSRLEEILAAGNPADLELHWAGHLRVYEGDNAPLIKSARFFESRGMPARGLEFLAKAKELGHATREILIAQAQCLRRAGEPGQALELLFQVQKPGDESTELNLALAATYIDLRMRAEAQACLEKQLFKSPEDPQTRLVFAQLYALTGHYYKALRLGSTIADLPDFQLEVGLLGLDCHYYLGQTGKRKEVLRRLVYTFPADPWIRVAWVRERIGRVEDAILEKEIKEIEEEYPSCVQLMAVKIELAVHQNDFSLARNYLYQAIDKAEWHEAVQSAHLTYAFAKNPKLVDWEFFEELAESGKYTGFFSHFIEKRSAIPLGIQSLTEYIEKARAQAPESARILAIAARNMEGITASNNWLKIAKMAPFNPEAWCGVGKGLAERGQFRSAAESFKRALDSDPQYAPAIQELAPLLIRSGQPKAALELARRGVKLSHENPAAWQVLVQCQMQTGDQSGALQNAWHAWELTGGQSEEIRNLLKEISKEGLPKARFLVNTGQFLEAWPLVQAALEEEPDSNEAKLLASIILNRTGEYAMAVNLASEALEDPRFAQDALAQLSQSMVSMNQQAAAMEMIRKLAEFEEISPENALVGWQTSILSGEEETAGKIEEKIKKGPDCPTKWINQAWNLPGNQEQKSAELWKKAQDAMPWQESILGLWGVSLLRKEAANELIIGVEQQIWDSRQPLAAFMMASEYLKQEGRQGEGMRLLGLVREESPQHLAAAFIQVNASIAGYRLGPALGILSEIKEMAQESHQLWELYGRVYHAKGNMNLAIESFEKSISLHAQDPAAWIGKGQVLLAQKKYEEAKKPLEKAVELAGRTPEMNFQLAKSFQIVDDNERAMKTCQEAMDRLVELQENGKLGANAELLDKVENLLEKLGAG